MGTFGVHNLTIAAQKTIFMSDAAYSTVLASHHRYFIAHSLIYISLIHKNGSKWVLSGHTISPCGSVLKNGSKWVLSGHTISPCATGPSHLRIRTEVNQNAKFLSYSKMGLNGYFLGTQSHHAALRKLNFAEKKNVIFGPTNQFKMVNRYILVLNLQPNHAPPSPWYR